MAFDFGSFFSPSAANIPLPSNVNYGSVSPFGYDASAIPGTQSSMLGGISGLSGYNIGAPYGGWASNITSGMLNDPNAAGYMGGAGGASGMGMAAARNQFGAGGSIYGTAFDPQQDLYNRTLNDLQQRTLANLSASGTATTPYGQSVLGNTLGNFNIDWQNAQLQRQIAGANAASGLQAGAAPLFMQSAAYPWQTGQTIGQAGLGNIGNLTNLGINMAQIPGQQISGWQNALGTMGGLQQQAYNQQMGVLGAQQDQQQQAFVDALNRDKQAAAEQQAMYSGIGRLAGGGLGFMMGGPAGAMIGSNLFGGGGGGSMGWGGGSNAPSSWYQAPSMGGFNPFARQFGGPVDEGQSYMVGEQGPERFVPHQSGMIVPNPATVSGGGSRADPGMGGWGGGIGAMGKFGHSRPGMGWGMN